MSQELRHKDIEETLDKYIYGIYNELDVSIKNHIGTICPFLVNTNVSGTTTKKRGACVLKFKDNYGILDVPGDGACFYHCMRLVRGLIQMENAGDFAYHFDDVVSLKTELFERMKEMTDSIEYEGTVIKTGDLDIIKHKVMRYLGRVTKTIYNDVKSKESLITLSGGQRASDFVKKTREILKLFNAQAGGKGIDLGELEYYFFLIMVTLFDIANGIDNINLIKDYIGTETAETPDINYDVLITCVNATMLETFYHAVIPDVVSIMDMDERGKDTFYNDEFVFRDEFGLCGGCNPMINRTDYIEEVKKDGVVIGEKIRAEVPQIDFFTLTPSFSKDKCKRHFILFNTGGHYQIMMNVKEFIKHKNPLKALYHSIIHDELKPTAEGAPAPAETSITLKGTIDYGGISNDIFLKPTATEPKEPNSFIIKSYGRQVGEGISPGDELFKSLFPLGAPEASGADASIQLTPIKLPTGDGPQPNPKPKPRPRPRIPKKQQYVKGKPLEVGDFSFLTSRDDIEIGGKTLFNLRFQESRKAPGTFTFFSLPQPTSIFDGGEQKLVFETGEQHKFRISTYEDFIFLFLKHLIVRIDFGENYVYQNWYTLLADYTFPDNSKLPTLTGLKGLKNGKCIPIKKALQLSNESFGTIQEAIQKMFPETRVTKFSAP